MTSLKDLNNQEKQLISCLYILPEVSFEIPQIFDFFAIEENEKVSFFDLIYDLCCKGWLSWNESCCSMPQQIRPIVQNELNPNTQNCYTIIHFFNCLLNDISAKEKIQKYESYIESVINKIDDSSKQIASLANNLAVYYDINKRYDKTITYLSKAIDIQAKIDTRNPELAFYYNNLAAAYRKNGNYRHSLDCSYKSIDISRQDNSKDKISLANSYSNISTTFDKLKNYRQAIEFSLRAISVGETVYDEKHPKLANLYYELAVSYYNHIEFSMAKKYIDRAVSIYKDILPGNHPMLNRILKDQKIFEFLQRIDERLHKYSKWIIAIGVGVLVLIIGLIIGLFI